MGYGDFVEVVGAGVVGLVVVVDVVGFGEIVVVVVLVVGLGVTEGVVGTIVEVVCVGVEVSVFEPMPAGGGKSNTGSSLSAPFMNSVQMRAGKEPPVTEVIPPMPFNDLVASER